MHFASPIPWWLALLAAAALVALAIRVYRRPLVPLTRAQRTTLVALRALALLALLALICRPIIQLPPIAAGDLVVPVLIDASGSMRLDDADGMTRMARATAIARQLARDLSQTARLELLTFADAVAPAPAGEIAADGRRTDLNGALQSARSRYRGQRIAGIVVISDGAETTSANGAVADVGVPVYAVGVGSPEGVPDREVAAIAAGDPRLDQAAADFHVSVVARGPGREPFELKVMADGVVVDSKTVTPQSDAPIDAVFTVYPNPTRASLLTAVVDAAPGEAVVENNRRSLAVSPAGRRRRVLMLSGAPGFEHSFMLRALGQDSGIDLDTIVRKGKNDANVDTFLVQAGGNRAAGLAGGFPATPQALFEYDAVVIANLEGDFFARGQLEQLATFVSERGGGLLVMGGRAFERRGFGGTALEEVLPVVLSERGGGQVRAAAGGEGAIGRDAVGITDEGLRHPVMRIGAPDQLRALWASLPPLADAAPLGGPRPGASVLAVTGASNGTLMPVIAVQQYGRGRAMVFGGEASWRWRMLVPAGDRRFDYFWRQTARWLAVDAPEPVSLTLPVAADAGDDIVAQVDARDRLFKPADDAEIEVRLTNPSGVTSVMAVRTSGRGRAVAVGPAPTAGLYRLQAEARRNGTSLGTDDRWIAVGNNEREFADPRLNEGTLQRVARESGGRYVRAADVAALEADIARAVPAVAVPQQRDLWHEPWTFLLVVLLLSAEWMLRRWWGLR